MTLRFLTDHPASVGETYFEHLCFAFRFGGTMVVGGLACLVHGVLPFCCLTSGSSRVRRLHALLGRQQPGPVALDEFNWSI